MAQYADVIEIAAPSQAAPGDRVDITVRIQNTYFDTIAIMVGGALEYGVTPWPGIDFPEYWANVDRETVFYFSGSFIMPDRKVTIHAYSYWYGTDGDWYFDDEMTRSVEVAAAPQPAISDFRIVDYVKV